MSAADSTLLTINAGSSSIKFALFRVGRSLVCRLRGSIEWSDDGRASLTSRFELDGPGPEPPPDFERDDAPPVLLRWLEEREGLGSLAAIGHRVVYGRQRQGPEPVTPLLIDELRQFAPDDPEHLPRELSLIEAFAMGRPGLPQVVCFDSSFHRSLPPVARLLPIPRRYQALGVERYGFHGLSYAYLMQALAELGDPAAATGRVILAHLGNGASMAGVLAGRSIDTSMGFTAASGLPMGTRSGDLDPGLVDYLARTEGQTAAQFQHMVHRESGLLGLSELSSDMRQLLALEATDPRAKDAIDLFCYQTKKWIGAFSAALGGLDTLVFAGGIGENAPEVRARACAGLGFLGVELDASRNAAGDGVISSTASRVTVRVIRTDEELVIAQSVARLLREDAQGGAGS